MITLRCACGLLLLTLLATPASSQSPVQAAKGATTEPRDAMMEAARVARRFGERFYRPQSGLIAALPFSDYATVLNVGSTPEMGRLAAATYAQRGEPIIEPRYYQHSAGPCSEEQRP